MLKIGLYTPYLDSLGGGERYMLTIAEVLSEENRVDLFLDQHLSQLNPQKILTTSEERFNLNLSKINLKRAPVGKGSTIFKRNSFLKNYDLVIYLTDGSIFYSTAKKNILHIQSPLIGQSKKNFWGKMKLSSWDLIIYNSEFTKNHAQKNWHKRSLIIYPPVDIENIKPLKKEKIILSVGRFFGYLKSKKQEFIIDVFKKLYEEDKLKDWKLILAGSAGDGDQPYINELREEPMVFLSRFYRIYLLWS